MINDIRRSEKGGNTVYLNLGVWYDAKSGSIHLTLPNAKWFHTDVTAKDGSARCHKNLFSKLLRALVEAGVPLPEQAIQDGGTSTSPPQDVTELDQVANQQSGASFTMQEALLPYGMNQNPDQSWTVFNRKYSPIGDSTSHYTSWNEPRFKFFIPDLNSSVIRKLDVSSKSRPGRVYFYDEGNSHDSQADGRAYHERLVLLSKMRATSRHP